MLKLIVTFAVVILMSASPGPENLTLEPEGEDEVQPEELTLGDESEVEDLSLSDVIIEMSVTTAPPGAIVYLDGDRFGITPIEGKTVATGQHYLSLRKKGFFPYEKDIVILGDEEIALILPIVEAPEGYDGSFREAESEAGVILELQQGAFRVWLNSETRSVADLAYIAERCAHLGAVMAEHGLNFEALKCRNLAGGFYLLIDLASGTDYFADKPSESLRIAKDIASDAASNDEELIRLTDRFILELQSFDGYTRAVAAHALRHTYSSIEAASNAIFALETVAAFESIEFIRLIIFESLEQIGFEPV